MSEKPRDFAHGWPDQFNHQNLSYILVVLLCMYRVIRPDYDVVKEGQISACRLGSATSTKQKG